MGDRYIYKCPNCDTDIYVGGGINENDDGIIHCVSCDRDFKVCVELKELVRRKYRVYYEGDIVVSAFDEDDAVEMFKKCLCEGKIDESDLCDSWAEEEY